MQVTQDLAIILKSVTYGERHRIVTALTRHHGKISALAQNSIQSKRFGGALDIFAVSEWTFSIQPGQNLYHLSEAQIREPFDGLKKNFEVLSLASLFTELILKLAPEAVVCAELFLLHFNALSVLNQPQSKADISLLNAYLIKFMQWSGHQPSLLTCFYCQKSLAAISQSAELRCLIEEASWTCSDCDIHHKNPITQNPFTRLADLTLTPLSIRDLQNYMTIPIRKTFEKTRASAKEHADLFKFLEAMATYHIVGFEQATFKSLRFLGLESTEQRLRGKTPQNLPSLF